MRLEKLLAWERIISDPRFLQCMKNVMEYRERLAYEVLTGSSAGPETPTTPTSGST